MKPNRYWPVTSPGGVTVTVNDPVLAGLSSDTETSIVPGPSLVACTLTPGMSDASTTGFRGFNVYVSWEKAVCGMTNRQPKAVAKQTLRSLITGASWG